MAAKFKDLVSPETPTLVDFWADWCQPCKVQLPILKDLAKHYGERLRIVKIDTEKNPQLASQLGIRSIPTLMLYKKGERVWQAAGVQSIQKLAQIVEPHLTEPT